MDAASASAPAPAPAPGPAPAPPPPPAPLVAWGAAPAAPPVTYTRSPAAATVAAQGSSAALALLSGPALAEEVRRMVASARHEVCVISPWGFGLDTLVDTLVAAPPAARVLVVSRRPEREDDAYHRGIAELGRRRAVTAFSPFLQTRMVVVDGERALVGAASLPPPGAPSREVAVLVEGAAAKAARDHFARVFTESGGTTVVE